MRRLAYIAAAAAAVACGSSTRKVEPGPRDRFFFPTGLAVLEHRLVVASSNADLTYDTTTGGTVIAVDPTQPTATLDGSINIRSFAGELGIADPAACPALAAAGRGASAVVPVRSAEVVYALGVGADGALSCDGCEIPVGTASRGDPYAVGIACDTPTTPGGPTVARAYVGYLRASLSQAWITQIDLLRSPSDPEYAQHYAYDAGQVRGFAYDSSRRRLYLTRTATTSATSLRYVDLANGCRFDRTFGYGGCRSATTRPGAVPLGVELRSIALSNETDPASPVRRAYVSARIYDAAAAASVGMRVGDYDGLLIVADLGEDTAGNLDFRIVDEIPIGYGAGDVRVLPKRNGKRDVVAVLAADDGVLWIYDDETGERTAIGRSVLTGAPLTGQGPFGVAVDPATLPGNVGRVYVGSFREHFVTPIDVPLDDPGAAAIAASGRINGGGTP